MIKEISVKLKQEFNKNWKVLAEGENYNIPETMEDLKILGVFPYFKIQNLWVFPKDHAHKRIRLLISLIQEIVGDDLISRETVSEAVRDEIKLYFTNKEKSSNEWHLANILKVVSSKSKKRIVIRGINGLQLKDFKQIDGINWKLLHFDENEINNVVNNESGDQKWKSQLKSFLNKKFKNKVVLLIETEGDLKTAKKKANHIATYLINTLRYFICIHASNTGKAHSVGIYLDIPKQVGWMNTFSVNLQDKTTTVSGSGGHFRHKYPLTKNNLEIIKKDWFAEKLWSLVSK